MVGKDQKEKQARQVKSQAQTSLITSALMTILQAVIVAVCATAERNVPALLLVVTQIQVIEQEGYVLQLQNI